MEVPERTSEPAMLVTCEHGGNRVPAAYSNRFDGFGAQLESHRGYDPGALGTARALARALDAPLLYSTVTRLLVDLNRERDHRRVFSDATRKLDRAERRRLLERFHLPYRSKVEGQVRRGLDGASTVVHISSHSFTPILDGRIRRLDVGLLYDPRRPREVRFSELWKEALERAAPGLRVQRNRPYYGTSDGLTRTLRRRFPSERYLGIELEVNQAFCSRPPDLRDLRRAIVTSVLEAVAEFGSATR